MKLKCKFFDHLILKQNKQKKKIYIVLHKTFSKTLTKMSVADFSDAHGLIDM